ncbi:MAG: DNA repair protein RecO [Pirellulaceae bacterium]
MAAEKSLAIVLRTVEFSESSYVATLFTEDFGKITALAKGARRRKSAFESALDLLSVSRVVFLSKSSDSLDLLTEARLEKAFRSSQKELGRFYAALYLIELVNLMTDNRDPHPDLFRTTVRSIGQLDQGAPIAPNVLKFELAILRHLGHLPALHACSECSRTVPDAARMAFGIWNGGVLCNTCKVGKRKVVSLSLPALQLLRSWSEPEIETTNDTDSSQPQFDTEWTKVAGEVRGLMNQYLCDTLGRRPQLFDFLGFH